MHPCLVSDDRPEETGKSLRPGDDPSLPDEESIGRRTAWFQTYTRQRNVFASAIGGPYTCPCCGHTTLSERGGYEICEECGWEDDGQDDHDSTTVRGGPNGLLSLDAARSRYLANGGVRQPHTPPGEPT
ncbi:CPCC family cysteine-rich protein [Amycolatopsis sp. NPDC057786]|uniref:CPCC family cysteine-rich protein n=1 Tax=Amycolatopsis sp. NPDC057786 TaxID=3346250 RepID=UPI0036710963